MSDLLELKASLGPQWRDTLGRYADAASAVNDELWQMGQAWGPYALDILKQATPVKTGATQRAWRSEYQRSKLSVTVSNKKKTVAFLLEGTRPHNIPGSFGYPLPFGVGGRFEGYFHPGQQRNAELVHAVERVADQAGVELERAGARIVRRLVTGS